MVYKIIFKNKITISELQKYSDILNDRLSKNGFGILDDTIEDIDVYTSMKDIISLSRLPQILDLSEGTIHFHKNGKFGILLPEFKKLVMDVIKEKTDNKVVKVLVQENVSSDKTPFVEIQG